MAAESPTVRIGSGLCRPRSTSPEDLKLAEDGAPTRTPSPTLPRPNTPTGTPSPTGGDEGPLIKAKTVSFHSTSCRTSRRIQSAQDCLDYMMEGSSLIKIRRNGRQYHRYFRLEPDLSAMRWTPTSKKASRAQVPIETIKEIRTGRDCESLRNKEFPPGYNEDRIFSILYGDSYESLDLVAHTPEEANIWIRGLNALIGTAQPRDPQELREMWLRENFERATTDSSGHIDQLTCIRLITKLDNQVATGRVKQKMQEVDQKKTDGGRGLVGIEDFIDIFEEIATRPEIYFLMIRFANKEYLTREDFHLFLEGEQGMSGLTEEDVLDIINKYEPSQDARRCGHILVDGFTKYLLSEDCDIFDPEQRVVCQDMSQPFTHYFISTSHNTYLLEDQLKGPSSADGYARVLTCGCRCVKVDVHDGPDEPMVYHWNTLTTKIPFRDVLRAIVDHAFDYSIYPMFIHLENHCSVRQQKVVAHLLKVVLGEFLYVHPVDSKTRLCDLSPEDLKFKIIIMGKMATESGEVSEEDEGGETTRNDPKKMEMSEDLSSLVSISRCGRDLDFQEPSNDAKDYSLWSISESVGAKLINLSFEDLVHHNKSHMTRIYPNSSRVDSSNYNPQDYWNAGYQLVSLNFQTPGQMMDVYEGKFRGNGGCGYVLKPSVMCEQISVFSATSRDTIPGVEQQILRIKVISGQCLPKPRGSSATKATVIDPYVVIQLFGIPADCAEARTSTVSSDGNFPVFDESFDFHINLPDLALVRFIVLDDDFIGDDFIGQCTIPFSCLQTGYRHVRLLSSMGEPLENATLFVHISESSNKGRGKSWSRKSKKCRQAELKGVGVRQADDLFKMAKASSALSKAEQKQEAVEAAWANLQEECGLDHTANAKQCLKVVIKRFLMLPGNPSVHIVKEKEIPCLRTSLEAPLPSNLHKLETTLEKLLLEMHHFLKEYESLRSSLKTQLDPALKFYDCLEQCLLTQGLKGRKANKAREHYAYNVRVIRGQIDRLDALYKQCQVAMQQVESTRLTLESLNRKERSPSVRERPKFHLSNRHCTSDNLSSYGSLGSTPIPSNPTECKPKSILKKSNSNIESSSHGYFIDDIFMTTDEFHDKSGDHILLKPPLHHSLSYTPGFSNSESCAQRSQCSEGKCMTYEDPGCSSIAVPYSACYDLAVVNQSERRRAGFASSPVSFNSRSVYNANVANLDQETPNNEGVAGKPHSRNTTKLTGNGIVQHYDSAITPKRSQIPGDQSTAL